MIARGHAAPLQLGGDDRPDRGDPGSPEPSLQRFFMV